MPTCKDTPRAETEWLTLPSQAKSLEEFRAFVLSRAECSGLPRAKVPVLELALEEILVNVITYGYEGSAGLIRVGCRADQTRFVVSVEDHGKYFNPLDREDPDVEATIGDRPVGGLGIHLVKSMVDHIRYSRVGESNVLEVGFTI